MVPGWLQMLANGSKCSQMGPGVLKSAILRFFKGPETMLDRSGLKKYSNPHRFKPILMAGSRVMSISWSGGVPPIFGAPPGGPI